MPRIALVSAFPPLACGVADGSARLAEALERRGANVIRVRSDRWTLSDLGRLRRACDGADVIHLRYPTQESRSSLLPHLLAVLPRKIPLAVTIYDISVMHALRRWSCFAFTTASWLIFTTEEERGAWLRMAPWTRGRSSVIPIGSNLPRPTAIEKKTPGLVAYFGLFRPSKGLDAFLEAARLSRRDGLPFQFVAIGREQAERIGYLDCIRKSPGAEAVEWRVDLDPDAASAAIAEAEYVYLPFPDGVSERRGSLMAALNSGAIVVTTRGAQTPVALDRVVKFAPGPAEAIRLICALNSNPTMREGLLREATSYLARQEWPAIADAHIEVYQRLRSE
ncbi:MAG: hypothetical protein ACRD2E_04625 [Terriglobales bacterium]